MGRGETNLFFLSLFMHNGAKKWQDRGKNILVFSPFVFWGPHLWPPPMLFFYRRAPGPSKDFLKQRRNCFKKLGDLFLSKKTTLNHQNFDIQHIYMSFLYYKKI
jgi:hypothetical protein